MMKFAKFISCIMLLSATATCVMAKTSWDVSVAIPMTQQSTTAYTVQHLPPSVAVGQHTHTTIRSVPSQRMSQLSQNNNVVVTPYTGAMSPQEYQQYRYYQQPTVVYTPAVIYSQPMTQIVTQTQLDGQGNIIYQTPQTTTTIVNHGYSPAKIHLRVGDVVPAHYRRMNYWVNDWQSHRLAPPPSGHLWMKIDGRFALVNQPDYLIIRMGN